MKLYKLNFYKARLKRLEEERADVEADITVIQALAGVPVETINRREYLIKKIEKAHKEQMEFEKSIEKIANELDKEILLRRYKGQTYEKIAYELRISFNTVDNVIRKYTKRD